MHRHRPVVEMATVGLWLYDKAPLLRIIDLSEEAYFDIVAQANEKKYEVHGSKVATDIVYVMYEEQEWETRRSKLIKKAMTTILQDRLSRIKHKEEILGTE